MSEILSQEQIDALLNSQGIDNGKEENEKVDRSRVCGALLKVFGLFCDQAGSVISTVINRKVVFKTDSCEQASPEKIHEKLPSVLLSVNISLKAEKDESFTILIQKKDAAVLSDLMLMGDGTAEYSEDHKDALGELFNQVTGAFAKALSSEWGGTVSSGKIEVSDFDADNPPSDLDKQNMILVSQATEEIGNTFLALMIPNDFSDRIAERIKTADDAPEDKSTGGVGLNPSELEELSQITSFGNEGAEPVQTEPTAEARQPNIEMLLDIELDVSIELGRSTLSIKRILELAPGSIVELDRLAGEPVDLLVNNKVVAKGEVVVVDENFGIRIVSLISPEERIKSLR